MNATAGVSVFDVFTPTTQARINFVERHALNERLVDAIRTPGKQIIIFGETGSGKSTLLTNKLEQLYESHIVTRCHETITFDQLLLDGFDQLAPYYEAGGKYATDSTINSTLGADFKSIRAQLDVGRRTSTESEVKRALPPQLTIHRLGQFLGERRICWVIEDFHKVAPDSKRPLAQSLKVFCDLARDYPQVKIIALGATDTAREVVEYDPEMSNRVAEIHVPLMTDDEIRAILTGGEQLLNIDLSPMKELVVNYSVGVGSICHQLALNTCTMREIYVTSPQCIRLEASDLHDALTKYIADQSDTLKSRFDRALMRMRVKKYDNCRLILRVLASGGPDGMLHSEILAEIRKQHPDYPASNLTTYLRELQTEQRGAVLRSGGAGRFMFVDPFHQLYCHLTLSDAAIAKGGLSQKALLEAILKEFEDYVGRFIERPAQHGPPRITRPEQQLSLFRPSTRGRTARQPLAYDDPTDDRPPTQR